MVWTPDGRYDNPRKGFASITGLPDMGGVPRMLFQPVKVPGQAWVDPGPNGFEEGWAYAFNAPTGGVLQPNHPQRTVTGGGKPPTEDSRTTVGGAPRGPVGEPATLPPQNPGGIVEPPDTTPSNPYVPPNLDNLGGGSYGADVRALRRKYLTEDWNTYKTRWDKELGYLDKDLDIIDDRYQRAEDWWRNDAAALLGSRDRAWADIDADQGRLDTRRGNLLGDIGEEERWLRRGYGHAVGDIGVERGVAQDRRVADLAALSGARGDAAVGFETARNRGGLGASLATGARARLGDRFAREWGSGGDSFSAFGERGRPFAERHADRMRAFGRAERDVGDRFEEALAGLGRRRRDTEFSHGAQTDVLRRQRRDIGVRYEREKTGLDRQWDAQHDAYEDTLRRGDRQKQRSRWERQDRWKQVLRERADLDLRDRHSGGGGVSASQAAEEAVWR